MKALLTMMIVSAVICGAFFLSSLLAGWGGMAPCQALAAAAGATIAVFAVAAWIKPL